MLSHLSIGTRNLVHAGHFYDLVLGALGCVRVWTAENAIGYGEEGGGDVFAIKEQTGRDTHLAAGPGFHIAFQAPTREAVDAFHKAALKAGGTSDGESGLRPHYGDNYYAAFVTDPDGHKLEAVHK